MSAPLSLLDELAASAKDYGQALERFHKASAKLTLAKRQLEAARARHLCTGVEGKNQAERDARLECLLIEEQTAVEFLEDEQASAKLRLEQARLGWDLARYKVRALEAMKEAA
jgi:hypothetical protein